MRTIFIILGTIAAVLTAIMAYLPFGSIALAPAVLGVLFGYLALRKTEKGKGYAKLLIAVSFIAGGVAVLKPFFVENKVEQDEQFELREQESQQEAIEELEELEELTTETDSIQ